MAGERDHACLPRSEFVPRRFSERLHESCGQVVASVLWLGNIGFSESEDGAGTLCSAVAAGGGMALERAARLLEVDGDALALCCTQRAMASREGVIVIPLSASQACDARDGLAKVLYSALFDWLIERIDTAMRPKDGGECPQQPVLRDQTDGS